MERNIRKIIKYVCIFTILGMMACGGARRPFLGIFDCPGAKPYDPPTHTYCPNDIDCDGFSDSLETSGLTTYGGKPFPQCENNEAIGSTQRANCMDSTTPDLFVVLDRNTPSLIPTNVTGDPLYPFGNVAKSVTEGGIGITVHEITSNDWNPSSHQVTSSSSQVAADIRESWAGTLSPFDASCQASAEDVANIILGETAPTKTSASAFVYPKIGHYSRVYPLRIVGYIDYKCLETPSASQCVDQPTQTAVANTCGLDADPTAIVANSLDALLIEHIIVHELGHQINLTKSESKKDGWHHSPGSYNEIMTKSVFVEDAVFKISDDFCSECMSWWLLHQY